MLLVDGDIPVHALSFSVQSGYGDSAELPIGAERLLEARVDEFIDSLLDGSGCEDYKVFLTSKRDNKEEENFRYRFLPDYKGARFTPKPLLHDYCREYLFRQHLAVPSSKGLEADDMIAIEHITMFDREREPSYIASIDKDFDQLPGWHYRWEMRRKNKIIPARTYFVSEWQGTVNLYLQALTGDKVDNIGYEVQDGKQKKCDYLKGLGEKKAKKILQDCKTEEELYSTCLNIYREAIEDESLAQKTLDNNMNCLYLVRARRFRDGKPILWRRPQ